MKTPSPAPNDPWKAKLQESLKQERPSPRRWGLWLSLLMLGGLALVAWWLYPATPPELPPLVTFDVVVPAGKEAPVRAMFEVEEALPRHLRGRAVIFQESRAALPGEELSTAEGTLDKDGEATAALSPTKVLRQVAFEARCPPRDRLPGAKDQAFLYHYPAKSNLLVVSIEGTLSLASLREWEKSASNEIIALPEAFSALHAVHRSGFEIVYLALEPDRPTVYQKIRNWVHARLDWTHDPIAPRPNVLPVGPVLGRSEYPGAADAAATAVLKQLKTDFAGQHVAVTASGTIAQRFQAAGFRTLLVGEGDPVPGVERVRAWDDLPRLLAKK